MIAVGSLGVGCGFGSVVWFGLGCCLWCFAGLLGIVNCGGGGKCIGLLWLSSGSCGWVVCFM